ncbi:MAG: gliding motility-associated C-terminal domain-containing protein [Bacteroidales bacterium]|nr:gliding motility-associated C-terminal domain-containing protein [Bacteroidales bacterium]
MKKKNIFKACLLMGALLTSAQSMAQCPGVWFFGAEHRQDEIYDTVANCAHPEIILQTQSFVPVQRFNGTYLVEEIPYNPADPSFHQGQQLSNISSDDVYDNQTITIDFPFCFFGQQKSLAVVSANGFVTFNTGAAGQTTPYDIPETNGGLPWTTNGPTTYTGTTYAKNAIYGIYKDLHPGVTPNLYSAPLYSGVYKSVSPAEDWPCRHVTVSWNEMRLYSCTNLANTYQIVFYEGTNIIEVHVKENHYCSSWYGGRGIIGIQNATGQTQVSTKNDHNGSFTDWIEPNSPGYFVPSNIGNPFTEEITNRAWRFTPQGTTRQNKSWYKAVVPNAENLTMEQVLALPDSVWEKILHFTEYTENGVNNPDAYLPDLNAGETSENDTNCVVTPKVTTLYKCKAVFVGATGYNYVLNAVSRVTVDTANVTGLESNDQRICHGSNSVVNLTSGPGQLLDHSIWSVQHYEDGELVDLPATRYSQSPNHRSVTLRPAPADQMIENHIDTTIIGVMAEYTNGCRNSAEIRILTYPNFDVHIPDTMCENDTYDFNGQTYSVAGDYVHNLTSQPGCDSTVTLHLATQGVTYFDDVQRTCEPYTWPNNNQTYYSSTSTPQVTLQNAHGCDSVVTLKLEVIPVHAEISLSPTGATLDNLIIRLTDISTGNDRREWMEMPNGATSESYIYNYTFPADKDSVQLRLRAISNLGCEDTAYVTIPMLKETIWLPNAFSPLADAPNNVFRPIGIGLTEMELWIYNRQGQLIHHQVGLDSYWDGITDQGVVCQQGAYVYRIKYANVLNPEAKQIKTGTITLIR